MQRFNKTFEINYYIHQGLTSGLIFNKIAVLTVGPSAIRTFSSELFFIANRELKKSVSFFNLNLLLVLIFKLNEVVIICQHFSGSSSLKY
jgi:hypothetical protein